VNFAAITLRVASQRVFIAVAYFVTTVRKLLDTPSYVCMVIFSVGVPDRNFVRISQLFHA
jgi:hypothetical protein